MNPYDSFFEEIDAMKPYSKVGFMGKAGSGKTVTATLCLIGVYKQSGCTKPVILFDTERSSVFLAPLFKQHSVPVKVRRSRTLPDLEKAMRFCREGGADFMLIDSITHVYEDFINDYKREKRGGGKYIRFSDWGIIKPLWKEKFTSKFVDDPAHYFMTGREGYDYDERENEDGQTELVKTRVKMKAENETEYEPYLLVHMHLKQALNGDTVRGVYREAMILKDKVPVPDMNIDGKVFKIFSKDANDYTTTYNHFSPHFNYVLTLLSENEGSTSDEATPNSLLFDQDDGYREDQQERKAVYERNIALLDEVAPGTGKEEKALKLALTKYAYYGETSDSAISLMNLGQLEEANSKLGEIVPVIRNCQNLEKRALDTKQIPSARLEHLETDNLGEASVAKLQEYLKVLANAFNKKSA